MKLRTDVLAAALTGVLALHGLVVAQVAAALPQAGVGTGAELVQALLEAANEARAAEGLAPLVLDDALSQAAVLHANDMVELGYFSHHSPHADRATLGRRLAYVGAPAVVIGENLALVGVDGDIAVEVVQGWLSSPGHRANLLNPIYDRVGYGAAAGDAGDVYVVQVFSFEPRELLHAEVVSGEKTFYRLAVLVQSAGDLDALVSLGKAEPVPYRIPPGESTIDLTTSVPGLQQIRIGVELEEGAGYVIDGAAWLEAAAGTFEPDPTVPRSYVRIVGVRSTLTTEAGVSVRLVYSEGRRRLAAFLDGQYLPNAEVEPGVLEIEVPTDRVTDLKIGVVDGNTASFFHSFTVAPIEGGTVALLAGPVEANVR